MSNGCVECELRRMNTLLAEIRDELRRKDAVTVNVTATASDPSELDRTMRVMAENIKRGSMAT